jgi:hypothetical protein
VNDLPWASRRRREGNVFFCWLLVAARRRALQARACIESFVSWGCRCGGIVRRGGG